MKVRTGFVSNSSSTSYILCIDPKEGALDWMPVVTDAYKNESQWFDENPPYLINDVVSDLRLLQDGGDIVERSSPRWHLLEEVIEELDMVVKTKEVGDFGGKMVNICTPECYDRIKRVL